MSNNIDWDKCTVGVRVETTMKAIDEKLDDFKKDNNKSLSSIVRHLEKQNGKIFKHEKWLIILFILLIITTLMSGHELVIKIVKALI